MIFSVLWYYLGESIEMNPAEPFGILPRDALGFPRRHGEIQRTRPGEPPRFEPAIGKARPAPVTPGSSTAGGNAIPHAIKPQKKSRRGARG